MAVQQRIQSILADVHRRDPASPEFHEAVTEVLQSMVPLFEKEPKYIDIAERMIEPERVIMFRVPWMDKDGKHRINRGYRVQFNSALGPYKGGLRLHPSVTLSVIKFLGFEQILKNSLTNLMMGGGKGGSDFDPKGKTDNEVMTFCQSFMTELQRHIGADTDVPAGDIGVGGREIGFLFGQYKRLRNEFTGVLTGKDYLWGGSLLRPEATGYGATYYLEEMLKFSHDGVAGKVVAISGSGNVSQYACEKVTQMGGKVITMSDSNGYVFAPQGINKNMLAEIMTLKNVKRGRLADLKISGLKYVAGKRPWGEKCDVAFPSATQNEINKDDAEALARNGCKAVVEGANMPSTPEAIEIFHKAKIAYGPAKAANAGGVATSGLEMSQDSMRLQWTREEVDTKLKGIMVNIFKQCVDSAAYIGQPGNFQAGANVGGFMRVAKAMSQQGLC